MAIDLFGWLFKRNEPPEVPSFSPKNFDDGAVTIAPAGAYGTFVDLDGTVRTEAELITRYRDMAGHPEVDSAIDEIINEMIAGDFTVKMILDDLKQPQAVKNALEECFDDVVELLDFKRIGYDITRRWYVDGRLYFHAIIDEANPAEGVQELRYIDPRKIRKVREIVKKKVRGAEAAGDATVTVTKNEYYIYNDRGYQQANKFTGPTASGGVRIAKDAIVHVTSGLTDAAGTIVLSYLHKAIKPLNQLRTLEDASIIYRLSRSPERRIWYVDVGTLPKLKAEQYLRDIMNKHKNRLNYDASTGEIRDDRKFMTMLEDYWLPQRDGKGTKVDVLPPGTSFNQIDDILFFQKKLFASLHVPINRLDPENMYADAAATGITRDEVKFGKFIDRMRVRFAMLFIKVLEKQVVLREVMSMEDFQKLAKNIRFDFVKDNYFMEQKEAQMTEGRLNLANMAMPFVGRYVSNEWVRKKILRQDDDDIEQIDKEIAEEAINPQYAPPVDPNAQDPNGGDGGQGLDPKDMAVIADAGAIPNEDPNPSKEKTEKPNPKSGNTKGKNFKSVAAMLAKGT